MDDLTLECMIEQSPDPDSRVTLAERVDLFGMPLSRIKWRISELEARTGRRMARLFTDEMKRLGLPHPALLEMVTDESLPFRLPDVAHPTGATRMSARPAEGVVDGDCRVHGMSNLYIAGSSVFPTSGHANPTQMIIALAIRLADHLKDLAKAA
jgi:choline dehydrogenase-like flavoprotein